MVGGGEDDEAILEVPVGLIQGGVFVFVRGRLWHRLLVCHRASTMMAEPMKMNAPPMTTGIWSWPLKNSTEKRATNRG